MRRRTLAGLAAVSVVNVAVAMANPVFGRNDSMELGAFSVSLAVADLAASEAFYQTLGFERAGGDPSMNYLIMRNGTTNIGLFEGMFEENILTFNPGWDQQAEPLESFVDVREIQTRLKSADIQFATEADVETDGPASFVVTDPDGNMILVDQHVPRPDSD